MKRLAKNQKGFVALFTVLIVSVVLAMAIGIASLSLKEIVLSSSASEGSKAFYAADSGIECALYFEKISPPGGLFNNLECNGNLPIDPLNAISTVEAYTFSIAFGENNELCADISVERGFTGLSYTTIIESKGSNVTCDDDDNSKKVERSIRVTY